MGDWKEEEEEEEEVSEWCDVHDGDDCDVQLFMVHLFPLYIIRDETQGWGRDKGDAKF